MAPLKSASSSDPCVISFPQMQIWEISWMKGHNTGLVIRTSRFESRSGQGKKVAGGTSGVMTQMWPDPLECQKFRAETLAMREVSSLKTSCYLVPDEYIATLDLGEKQLAGGGIERVTEESVDGFIESKGTSSTNEYSEDKEMEQSGTIDSFDKSSDCSSSKEKPNDLDTGVDGNKQSHDGSQDFEVTGGFDEDQ
ncbi:hypothetical protein ElyMa_006728900 [Elysia marginata]|uniref:Uncharacterized protein n=1 Tax=Elysia marginata TaxID=1093978 RepID=A0AAV4ITL5_9GAST|nr:hypothetical protein ElyMa_006728900 [Elysia marginata]